MNDGREEDNEMPSRPMATVELKSDLFHEGPKRSKRKGNKKIMAIVGVVVALVLVAALAWVAARSGQRNGGDDSLTGGDLPMAGEREEKVTISSEVSGLSGMSCENANRRPVAVMLASDPINRPVSGFAKADMVWELPVLVSNVTRLMAVYQCGEPTEIGSVRSARHDYLFLADGIDAILAHWGGSFHALNRITAGEFQTMNALTNPYDAFYRKDTLPAPYNGFTSYKRLWEALQKLGYRTETQFAGYEFKDDAPMSERPAGGTLSVDWPGQFRVSYEYDPETNRYVRYWGGVEQTDPESGTGVAPSVVVIMRATNQSAVPADGGYNDVSIEGTGELMVYQDGQEIKGTWRKDELNKKDPVHFMDETGEEITFTRGQVWVMAPDPSIPVTWVPESSVASPTGAAE